MFRFALGALVAVATVAVPASAWPCTPPTPVPSTAVIPAPGATGVPRVTPIILRATDEPKNLQLTIAGQPQSAPVFERIGEGILGLGAFWRMQTQEPLAPSAAYVLTALGPGRGDGGSGSPEILRFTTAADIDVVEQPQAPVLQSVSLMRVHYSKDEIGAGSCVLAEYQGFVQMKYDAAVFPVTPASAVIYAATLSPRDGASAPQQVLFLGDDLYDGEDPRAYYYRPVGFWHPDLAIGTEYCLELSAFGYGGPASAVKSESICAMPAEHDTVESPKSTGCSAGCRDDPSTAVLALGLAFVFVRRR